LAIPLQVTPNLTYGAGDLHRNRVNETGMALVEPLFRPQPPKAFIAKILKRPVSRFPESRFALTDRRAKR
jgi:hypothetical protein